MKPQLLLFLLKAHLTTLLLTKYFIYFPLFSHTHILGWTIDPSWLENHDWTMFYWWILWWCQSPVIVLKSSFPDPTSCTPCSSGTYSLGDPYQTNACNECPDDMTCLGGDIYFPVEGYWRISETSDNVVQCFNNEACLYFINLLTWYLLPQRGGQQDSGRDVSLTGFCGAGYHGIACGNCDPGYAKFGSKHVSSSKISFIFPLASQKCVNCSKNAGYYIRFILYLAIQIIIIIFATK